jgi:hypothetical protein
VNRPWRRQAAFSFIAARSRLTNEQRVAILALTATIAQDPYGYEAIIYPNGDREGNVAGVWVRYRIDDQNRAVIFLDIAKT